MVAGYVFISYSREDHDYVEALASFLGSHNIATWHDCEIGPGDLWNLSLEEMIDGCAAVIVVITPSAAKSINVSNEIMHAQGQRKAIFPLRLAGSPPLILKSLQYDDVRGGSMPSERLLERLRRLCAKPVGGESQPLVASHRDDLEPDDFAIRHALVGHTDAVYAVAIAPDGTWLASAGADETTRVWDAASGTLRRTLVGHTGPVNAVAIAPDGSWLATASKDQSVSIWDPATGERQAVFAGHADEINGLSIAPDGAWLATGSDDRTVRVWDMPTGADRRFGDEAEVNAVAVAPSGAWLAAASKGKDSILRLLDPVTGEARLTFTVHQGWVWSVAIAPDETWLAAAVDDGTIRLWDLPSGAVRGTLSGHDTWVWSTSSSPDSRWLASGGNDCTVRLWDAMTGTQLKVLTGHSLAVRSVAVAPNGRWIASASVDKTVRIWGTPA